MYIYSSLQRKLCDTIVLVELWAYYSGTPDDVIFQHLGVLFT